LNSKHGNTGLLRFVDNIPDFIYNYLLGCEDDVKKGLLILDRSLPKNVQAYCPKFDALKVSTN
jgi:hypothetical protein